MANKYHLLISFKIELRAMSNSVTSVCSAGTFTTPSQLAWGETQPSCYTANVRGEYDKKSYLVSSVKAGRTVCGSKQVCGMVTQRSDENDRSCCRDGKHCFSHLCQGPAAKDQQIGSQIPGQAKRKRALSKVPTLPGSK